MNMTNDEKKLWDKIRMFTPDEPGSALTFSQRLARENRWTHAFALAAIEEYRRFIFLCTTSEKGATPSDQVDQVWHLHLTYTRSYWNTLCRDILGKEIHHNPTKGGRAEGEKFEDMYHYTLNLYRRKFGQEPPPQFWPDATQRFDDIDFQRINLRKFFLLPKPASLKRAMFALPLILIAAMLSIQAYASKDFWVGVSVLILIAAIGWLVSRNSGGGNGSGGGCGSGCGGTHHGDSGCSASGCSGCGGGCGGD